jgi:hypothetical protein
MFEKSLEILQLSGGNRDTVPVPLYMTAGVRGTNTARVTGHSKSAKECVGIILLKEYVGITVGASRGTPLQLSGSESLFVFAGNDEGFHHLRVHEVAVELIELP